MHLGFSMNIPHTQQLHGAPFLASDCTSHKMTDNIHSILIDRFMNHEVNFVLTNSLVNHKLYILY